MSRAAWRHQETVDGQALPRSPKLGDRCNYCGVTDGDGNWLVPDGDTGWLCEDCR